jgi:predicted transcriptional regulator
MHLTPVEKEILEALYYEGHNVPSGIADIADRPAETVSRSLSNLKEKGLVRKKNRYGVWMPTAVGREVTRDEIL